MKKKYKGALFDLFFTLVEPKYIPSQNEYDILRISQEEWEQYAENNDLYRQRILGKVKDPRRIIGDILQALSSHPNPTENLIEQVLSAREKRFAQAFDHLSREVPATLLKLKKAGIKLGLISNADVIDVTTWSGSALAEYFDVAIFSCQVGMKKPDKDIYLAAMDQLGLCAKECIYIGDGGDDELSGAKTAGMDTVLMTRFRKRDPAFAQTWTDYRVDTFKNLENVIIN